MAIDFKQFNNRFNIQIGEDGKCKECKQFHRLNIEDKLIADCNGNFNPSQHTKHVKAEPVKPSEENSAILGTQIDKPMESLGETKELTTQKESNDFNWAIKQLKQGKKITRPPWACSYMDVYIQQKEKQNIIRDEADSVFDFGIDDFEAIDWKIWKSVDELELTCKLLTNGIHICEGKYFTESEAISLFIKLTKKQIKEFKQFQEKLL